MCNFRTAGQFGNGEHLHFVPYNGTIPTLFELILAQFWFARRWLYHEQENTSVQIGLGIWSVIPELSYEITPMSSRTVAGSLDVPHHPVLGQPQTTEFTGEHLGLGTKKRSSEWNTAHVLRLDIAGSDWRMVEG